jgi:hypothetical protein
MGITMMVNRNGAAQGRTRGLPIKAALAILAVVLTAAIALASPLPGIIRSSWPARSSGGAGREESERSGNSGYMVKASDGKVAVFMPPGGEPVVVTGVDVSTLRSHDIALLENGVSVNTYEQLIRLLEDFSS